MASRDPEIAIVGAGPAGCALACFLRQRGAEVVVFDNGRKPDLLVGESLIPAAVPLLRRLGIEERVKSVSVLKPGASLMHVDGLKVDFVFKKARGKAPGYAYNIPRPEFDGILIDRAKELGVRFVQQRALVSRDFSMDASREISLSDASRDALNMRPESHPQLLIDASGRARLFARTLEIDSRCGTRNDIAYFAHFKNCVHDDVPPGQIIITVLKHGWSWRIPLNNRMSVGVVVDQHAARHFGDTAHDRLEAMIQAEPVLAACVADATRVTPVRTYSNYQLISERGCGHGWAMVGDAFGFVDPMLSPGVFMALESAALLDQNLRLNRGRLTRLSLDRYSRQVNQWHMAWQETIEHLYDGSLLRLYEAGKDIQDNAGRFSHRRIVDWYYQRIIGQLVSGTGTRSVFKRRVLRAGVQFLADSQVEPDRHAIMDGYPGYS